MRRTLTVSAINFTIRPLRDFDNLVGQIRRLLDASAGADIVVFPELYAAGLMTLGDGWPHRDLDRIVEVAAYEEALDGLFAAEATARGQHVLAGSTLSAWDGGYRNLATLHGPEGVVQRHAKTRLVPAERGFVDRPGTAMQTVDIGPARVGINVCYEIQFADAAAALADQGAEVVLCPSYTLTERGFWRVRHCAHARAIEQQLYVVHSGAGGASDHALPGGFARAAVLSPCDTPWGPMDGVLAESATNEDAAVVVTLDLDALAAIREQGETTTFRERRASAGVTA